LNINALSSTAPLSKPNTFNTFQGQERTEEFDLNWIQFKWRNHDPQTGRFFNIDPLAHKYLYNNPYAFSENKVITGVELEGLEYVHYSVLLDRNGKPKERSVIHDYRGQAGFDYKKHSESFGPEGRGVKYSYYRETAKGVQFQGSDMEHDQGGFLA